MLLSGRATIESLYTVRRFVVARQLDESVLRHFTSQVSVHRVVPCVRAILTTRLVAQVAQLVEPPFSHAFINAFASLLSCPLAVAALRGDLAKDERDHVNRWLDCVAPVTTVKLPVIAGV